MVTIHLNEGYLDWFTSFDYWWRNLSGLSQSSNRRWARSAWIASQRGGSFDQWLAVNINLTPEMQDAAKQAWDAAKKSQIIDDVNTNENPLSGNSGVMR